MRAKFSLLLLFPSVALAQVADGIPDPTGTFTKTNVCFQSPNGPVCEVFNAPDVTKDLSVVKPIEVSPRDPSRSFDNLPNFGIAKFHWWLFSQAIHRSQRYYSDCVSKITELQLLLGEPLIDSPSSVDYPGIVAVKEYEIPFEAIQNISGPDRPPSLRDAIEHVKAAASTVNNIIFATHSCLNLLNQKRQAFYSRYGNLLKKVECLKKASTKKKRKSC